jgi:glycosyltransferase involved in cell wall biosynthesis
MKLLLAAPHYPPTYVGGVELYVQRLAGYVGARGIECHVVAVERWWQTRSRLVAARREEGSAVVWRLDVPAPDRLSRTRAAYGDPAIRDWLIDLLRRQGFDLVHLHSGYLTGGAVLEAARACGVPVVITLHDYWFICPRITLQQPDGSICSGPETPAKCALCLMTARRRVRWPVAVTGHAGRRVCEKMCAWLRPTKVEAIVERQRDLAAGLLSAARILSPSRFLIDQMARAGIPRERLDLFQHGIPERVATPRLRRERSTLRLGFLGQIAPHKGVHVVIEAVRAVRVGSVELVIGGHLHRDSDYVSRLRRLASNDPRIVFGGPVENEALGEFFASIDLLVVPSVWYENSPFVIHEARMAGVPVLASDLGGMAELVRHDVDGLLARPGDPASFAEQIGRVVTDPTLLPRLRANVRRPPSLEEEFAGLLGLYRDVCSAEL